MACWKLYQTNKFITGHVTIDLFEIEGSRFYGRRKMPGHQCARPFIANPILADTQIN